MWETLDSSEAQKDKVKMVIKEKCINSVFVGKELGMNPCTFSKDYHFMAQWGRFVFFVNTFQRSGVL